MMHFMNQDTIREALRFYFITDDTSQTIRPLEQVRLAIDAGATIVQYRHKTFSLTDYAEVAEIRRLCSQHHVPFLINDNILLAKAVGADGVHVGQDDSPPRQARQVMGTRAIIGVSVSTMAELGHTDLTDCDYIGMGPVFPTGTKTDAKPVQGLTGLRDIVRQSPVPVVAIGGIDSDNTADCMAHGAAGVAVISCITRAADPARAAQAMAAACGLRSF